MYIRSVCDINNNNDENKIKIFSIPLSMCKDEFLTEILKICGYSNERYGRDTVIKYLIQCQLNEKNNFYSKLYVKVPIWSNT